MGALHLLSYIAGAGAFVFVLLSLASGLLYVADIIEEQSATAKIVGKRMIYGVIVIIVTLHFTDKLPWHLTGLLVFSHLVYLQNFGPKWPVIALTSPFFILSCGLVLASHFASFRHFSERGKRNVYTRYRARSDDTFLDVATFFGVCVWLVPFFLFLSLSANDNVLPSSSGMERTSSSASFSKEQSSSAPPVRHHQRHQSSIIKTFLSNSLSKLPISKGKRRTEGIIAPPSPTTSQRGSPYASPQHSPTSSYPPRLQMPPRKASTGSFQHQRSGSGSYSMPPAAAGAFRPPGSPSAAGSPVASYFDGAPLAMSPSIGDKEDLRRSNNWQDLQNQSTAYKRK